MKAALAWLAVLAVSVLSAVQCIKREPTPEELIEQQPSGAGPAVEQRPGYFRKAP